MNVVLLKVLTKCSSNASCVISWAKVHTYTVCKLDASYSTIIQVFLQSKKERARKFLTKRADYLLDKYSDITALDIDCQDGDVCILVWIKSGSAVKDQLLQEDFDGLAVDVRVGEMRCTVC